MSTPTTMKAFQIQAPGQTGFVETAVPKPAEGEVLVKVRLVGYCGSDLNTFRGRNPMVTMPRIPGHEIAATIEAVGPGVPPQWKAGMNVTLSPYTACGKCPACRRNRPNACQFNQTLGVQRDGALTEYLTVPHGKLYASPKLSIRELVMVEPLTVGFHAAARGQVAKGETVLVFGCGAIGLGAVAGAAWRGGRVIAVDLDDTKLERARKVGAAETINTAKMDLHQTLEKLIPGGPDVCIEAIGLPATFQAAVNEVSFTGRVVYIGYAKDAVPYETKQFVQKEVDIRGSRNALPEDFAAVIQMMEMGKFPIEELITQTWSFADAPAALTRWDKDPASVTKFLVEVG